MLIRALGDLVPSDRLITNPSTLGLFDGNTLLDFTGGLGCHIVGYSHPVKYEAPKGIKISVENNTVVKIEGADKEVVGQVAAELRSVRPPEPYKGKGIRYQGEQVRRKAGKTGAK